MRILFATNNLNKLREVKAHLSERFDVLGLSDIGFTEEIPEAFATLEENAAQKSRFLYDQFKIPVFSDDTGLEIKALNGEPGVYSARYAGPHCSSEDNMVKVLQLMQDQKERHACFRTVISLVINGKETQFEGQVDGKILTEKHGDGGFGYDPIFKPNSEEISFAQMSLESKNKISHRGRAVTKLIAHLNDLS